MRLRLWMLAGLIVSMPAFAQEKRVVPVHAKHAVNPGISLATRPSTPLEQQVQQNYRAQLLEAQRELQQSNPSGLGRAQIAIGHELNLYNNAVPR